MYGATLDKGLRMRATGAPARRGSGGDLSPPIFWQITLFQSGSRELKFGYSEKATKFEKIFHLKFDATQ